MATIQSLERDIQTLAGRLDDILGQSAELRGLPESTSIENDTLIAIQKVGEGMTGVKRGLLASALANSVRRISDNPALNEVTDIGQIAIGQKTGINDGNLFVGVVSFYPPTTDTHIQKIYYTF